MNETYVNQSTVRFGEDERVLIPDGEYQVVICVNGEQRWNETVHNYDIYRLNVTANGTVTVVAHGEM